MSTQSKMKRTVTGKVVSNKSDKTIVVQVTRRVRDPIYEKSITKSKKFHAHDETNQCNVGDIVKIIEHRPISKLKTWVLGEVVERAK